MKEEAHCPCSSSLTWSLELHFRHNAECMDLGLSRGDSREDAHDRQRSPPLTWRRRGRNAQGVGVDEKCERIRLLAVQAAGVNGTQHSALPVQHGSAQPDQHSDSLCKGRILKALRPD